MLETSATAAAWRRPRSGSCSGTGGCLTSADPVERGPAPLLPLRRPHGPTSPPGPTDLPLCSPDRADSCRPLDRLGRYESDCTARVCLAPLSRSANSLQVTKLILPLELELAIKAAGGLDADHGIFDGTLPSDRSPLRATASPSRAPTGRTASRPRLPTPSQARAGCGRPPSGSGIHRDALKVAFGQWACRRWRGGWAGSPAASSPTTPRPNAPSSSPSDWAESTPPPGVEHDLAVAAQGVRSPRPGHAGRRP
jgi:hypothetical protein